MKRLFTGWLCAVWLISAACAKAEDAPGLFKKIDASQTVTIPWNDLDERVSAIAKQMMERPTLVSRSQGETFSCMPEQYYWLLDNPDRAITAWRRLGAKCVTIQRRPNNKFGYVDDAGSDVAWETVHQAPGLRIWFAEGKVKPNAVLPLVPVKAMILLRYTEGKLPDGSMVIQHHSEVVIHTDSKVANAATKLMGASAPKLAEQGLGQLQLFFSALACYLDRHPDRVETLFRPETTEEPANPMKR